MMTQMQHHDRAHLICIHSYLDLLPEELASVIEARKILELTQQFYRGLRAVSVQLRHVQVIHKHHQFLVTRSSYREGKGKREKEKKVNRCVDDDDRWQDDRIILCEMD